MFHPDRPARTARRAGTVLVAACGALSTLAVRAGAQAADPPVVGRWDLRVTQPDGSIAPSWLEVWRSGARTLVGRFVGSVGSARPIGRIELVDGTLRFAIPPQWEEGTADLTVEGTVAGDRMTGALVTPAGERRTWTAMRAPALRRATPPRWGTPIRLFDGRSLAGWTTQGGENRWRVVNGVLTNTASGGNLVTTRRFEDFRLHLEFRVPKAGNSGVYLRGRYEVQIEDSGDRPELGPLHVGGVYGFLPPNANASRRPGEWQTYDITLVGRRVTVVLNGRAVIVDQLIPGITGGALDAEEGAPGPIMLQGDHTAVEFRNVVLTPAR